MHRNFTGPLKTLTGIYYNCKDVVTKENPYTNTLIFFQVQELIVNKSPDLLDSFLDVS